MEAKRLLGGNGQPNMPGHWHVSDVTRQAQFRIREARVGTADPVSLPPRIVKVSCRATAYSRVVICRPAAERCPRALLSVRLKTRESGSTSDAAADCLPLG